MGYPIKHLLYGHIYIIKIIHFMKYLFFLFRLSLLIQSYYFKYYSNRITMANNGNHELLLIKYLLNDLKLILLLCQIIYPKFHYYYLLNIFN